MAELIAAKQVAAQSAGTAAGRAAWDSYGESLRRPYPAGMAVEDALFAGGALGDRKLSVRVYRPRAAAACGPCVLYVHGGAFIKGSLESGDTVASGVADHVGAVVVSIDCRLAPEHPFPAALEDCHATLSHIAGQRPTGNPYAAQLKAADLTRLPPNHIHIAEIDPLADDGRAYAERLAAAGSPVELRSAPRMIHGFLRARFTGPAAAAEFARPCAFLRRHLGL